MTEAAGIFDVECQWDGKAIIVRGVATRRFNGNAAALRTPIELSIEVRYVDPADVGEFHSVSFRVEREHSAINQSDLDALSDDESWRALDALVRRWAWRNRRQP